MLKIYNSLSHRIEDFKPLHDNQVGIYACGPTVYDYAHIGNLRTYIFEDILKRVLMFNGFSIKHVINITDVGHLTSDADDGEDKMTKALRRENKPLTLESMREVADFYTAAFKADIAKLNILPPDVWCAASDHIPEQVELIRKLEAKGYAYRADDGIYFDTEKFAEYGKLAGLKKNDEEGHSRISHASKRNQRDFALWKFNETLGWESPWGQGFPGWHIECSAMSMKYLGESFDIHCGGIDHIPIHHTNEIAQSEAATGVPLAHFWVHGNFLQLSGGTRMGKSAGNLLTVSDLEKNNYHPLDYRYLTLTAHYRSPLAFSLEALNAAKTARMRLNSLALSADIKSRADSDTFRKEFATAVNDDLDMPRAVAAIWNNTNNISFNDLVWADAVLGLGLADLRQTEVPTEVLALVALREHARKDKNWQEADALRKQITGHGWIVEDAHDGPKVKKS
jgi:cysteinyl-tRNA synthetase